MRKNLLNKFSKICVGLVLVANCQAQTAFQYTSSLGDIKSPGFYKVLLPPDIVAKSRNELNDIRILNDKGTQVPYILQSDKKVFEEKSFAEFPILTIKKEADKQTHIIIQNKTGKTVNELLLVIKNTDAERTITLSGSDDQKQWFIIKERISLSNISIPNTDRFVQSLNFPNSSYKFFELIINGKDLLPLNIVKVGVQEGLLREGGFIIVPEPTIIQKDSSDKRSYISLLFNDKYLVNKLTFNVTGPKFFRRHLTIQSENVYFSNSMVVSSDTDPSYTVNIKARKILLIIENQDNPPLKFQSIKAFQLNKYLQAYLEPANKYELVFGDSAAGAPKYDLGFFKDSLNNNLTALSPGPIIKVASVKSVARQDDGKNMWTLWIIIAAVLLLLTVLTFRMTKEIAKKDKE